MITIISFIITNVIVSWIGSVIVTGKPGQVNKPIHCKKWKTFLIFFTTYSIIFLILYFHK